MEGRGGVMERVFQPELLPDRLAMVITLNSPSRPLYTYATIPHGIFFQRQEWLYACKAEQDIESNKSVQHSCNAGLFAPLSQPCNLNAKKCRYIGFAYPTKDPG